MRHLAQSEWQSVEQVAFQAVPANDHAPTFEAVAPEQAEAFEHFYRRRKPLQTQLLGRGARIKAAWSAGQVIETSQRRLLRLSIDGREAWLMVAAPLMERLLGGVDAKLAALPPPHAALLLELALSEELGRIEAISGMRIQLLSLAPGAAAVSPPMVALTLSIEVEGLDASDCRLVLAPADAVALAVILDAVAGVDRAFVEDFGIPLCVRFAAASPTVGDLKSLRRGDIMLIDDGFGLAIQAIAVIGEQLVAPVDLVEPGIRFSSRPATGRGSAWEWSMETPTKPGGTGATGLDDIALDALPVRVLFEIGRLDLVLGELRSLDVGAVLPLARGVDNAVDIVASGKRIGRGTLIKIGESLGVRVTRLFDHG